MRSAISLGPTFRHSTLLRHWSLVIRHLSPLLLAALLVPARAQTTNPPPLDPLISLMVSQPKIDITLPVRPTAAFDPPVVAPGQEAIYRVTFNALEETVDWPDKIATPPGLEMSQGAHGEILRMGPGSFQPLTAFNYRVRPSSVGTFNVPEFSVSVYGKPATVPAARLEVVASPPAPAQSPLQALLELPATNLFVGQAIRARVLLPGSMGGAVQGLAQVQLSGHGFLVDLGGARQRIESLLHRGTRVPAFIYEATLTPMVEGNITVFGQGFAAGSHFSGSIVIMGGAIIPGGPPQYTLVETEPVVLHVRRRCRRRGSCLDSPGQSAASRWVRPSWPRMWCALAMSSPSPSRSRTVAMGRWHDW